MSPNDDIVERGVMVVCRTPEDIGAAVKAVRRARGLTQAALATAAGVGRQWLVEVERGHSRAEVSRILSLLPALGESLELAPPAIDDGRLRGHLTVPALAVAVRDEVGRGDTGFALRLIGRSLDEFTRLDDDEVRSQFLQEPASTGDHRWDALISAAFGRQCRIVRYPAPEWTRARPLPAWWFPVGDRLLMARTMQRTPIDFKVLGIWLDRSALQVA